MLDRQTETLYYPHKDLALADYQRVLCVAPHPDDEVFGPGGLLALLADRGCAVEVLILTRGECAAGEASAGMANVRVQESGRAAARLGLGHPVFLDWPDRGVRYSEPLIASLTDALNVQRPQLLLLPALSEPHPDHQALALAGLAAAQRCAEPPSLLFYEVGAPMHPNVRVDISAVAERKWSAAREFTSQEALQPYESNARALASLRAFGLGPACTAAEAFFLVEPAALREQGAAAALPWWPLMRVQQQVANSPAQLPLVSVLVRSMDRPQLSDAIASVAAQTYPNIEVVVLNASGRPHGPVPRLPHWMTVRLVQPGLDEGGQPQACDRSNAANLALQAAQGQHALFLDDDDLIGPGHVEKLVAALQAQPKAVAAYSGVRVEGANGEFLRNYDLPWSAHRLQAINFLPIHAVLFRLDRARAASLRFDESLPVMEDWQFWRDLAACGHFVHCPGVSALYRQMHGQSGIGDPSHPNHWQRWHQLLLERSVAQAAPPELARSLAWHALELDQLGARHGAQAAELVRQRQDFEEQLKQLNASHAAQLARLQAGFEQLQAESYAKSEQLLDAQARHGELERAHQLLQQQIAMMTDSRSWRITQPLRAISGLKSK